MHADIADEDRLLGQRATDLVRGALRVDRGRVVAVAWRRKSSFWSAVAD
jgi:hypothetical protein